MWFFSYSWWIWFGVLGFGVLGVYIVGWVKCVQWCGKGGSWHVQCSAADW